MNQIAWTSELFEAQITLGHRQSGVQMGYSPLKTTEVRHSRLVAQYHSRLGSVWTY